MKKYLLAALIMLLTACLSPSGLAPQTVEPTPTTSLVPPATATPVPTLEPTLTPEPVDEELLLIQEFIVGNEKLPDLIGNSPNAELTATGELKITKKDGSVVTISKSDLASSMYFYDGVFQIREHNSQEEGRLINADYVLDPETNTMLAVSDYLPGDIYDPKTYPSVNNVNEYYEFFRQASLFLTEAPENTYRPSIENRPEFSTYAEAATLNEVDKRKLEFPYGITPEGMVSPIPPIKESFMITYNVEGVPLIINLMKIASFNPDDPKVSLVSALAFFSANADNERSKQAHQESFPFVGVPMLDLTKIHILDADGSLAAIRQLYKDLGIVIYGHQIDKVVIDGTEFSAKEILEEWRTTGMVPDKMQKIIFRIAMSRP